MAGARLPGVVPGLVPPTDIKIVMTVSARTPMFGTVDATLPGRGV